MQVSVSGTGTLATISTCPAGGAERVELDGNGETAGIECLSTTGVNTGSKVTAVSATTPGANPKIRVRDSSGRVRALLAAGQTMTVGSPVTASLTNSGTILVELSDQNDVVVGSFELDPGESVDPQFIAGPNGEDLVNIKVLIGTVTFRIAGQMATMTAGQTAQTFTLGAKGVIQSVLNQIIGLRAGISDKQDGDKLDEAVKHLTTALDPGLWAGPIRVQSKGGEKVFNETKGGATKLRDLLKNKKSAIVDTVHSSWPSLTWQFSSAICQLK